MMNCKRIEELLPLYVDRDLDAKHERLVTAHVESCATCWAAAGEYRETRQLLHDYAAPGFSEEVYTEMRQHVWRQIETESHQRASWEVIIGLLRPRPAWAFAAGVLIFALLLGIYLVANRTSVSRRIAVNDVIPQQSPQNPDAAARVTPDQVPARPVESKVNATEKHLVGSHPTRRPPRSLLIERNPPTVALSAPSAKDGTSSSANSEGQFDLRSDLKPENSLRMEIQTKNPNIRIIWFSQPDRKRVSPTSKGI